MHKLNGIDIVFENVESYYIPAKDIKRLGMRNVTRQLEYDSISQFDERLTCEVLDLELDAQAMKELPADQWADIGAQDVPSVYERIIRYNDIVSITLHYDDGTEEDINVPWGRYGDDVNTAMLANDFDGSLEVSISDEFDHDPDRDED